MNPRVTIEPFRRQSIRSVTYRIDGLVAVHLTQRLTSAASKCPKQPTISWVSAAPTSDLTYIEAFQECLAFASTVAAEWAADAPASLQASLFCQPVALPDQMNGNLPPL